MINDNNDSVVCDIYRTKSSTALEVIVTAKMSAMNSVVTITIKCLYFQLVMTLND